MPLPFARKAYPKSSPLDSSGAETANNIGNANDTKDKNIKTTVAHDIAFFMSSIDGWILNNNGISNNGICALYTNIVSIVFWSWKTTTEIADSTIAKKAIL